MAGQRNPFDQFDGPANGAGVQVLVPESPVVQAKDAADLTNARLTGQRTRQGIGIDAQNAARAAESEARQRQALAAQLYTQGLRIGANGQPEAIPGWKDPKKASAAQSVDPAAGLQRAINDMRNMYRVGPGATKGIAGAADYFPTQSNKAFDKAASAARGYVGPALGLTASQLNSPGEIEAAIGPYIPTSSDYDANIESAFDRLQGLAGDQRKRAGYTGPVDMGQPQQQQQQNPAAIIPGAPTVGGGGTNGGSGPAGYDVATTSGINGGGGGGGGNFTNAAGIAMAQKMKAVYNRGGGVAEINRLLQDNGFQPLSDAASISAIQKRGPINFAPPQVDDTRGGVGRALGSVADSPFGAYAINSADALTGNNLDSLAGGSAGLAIDYANQRNPTASMLGTIAGSTIAAGGAELGLGAAAARAGMGASPWVARGADALYGAVSGAGSADGEGDSRLLGAAVGGVAGLGGGMAGRAAARGAGNLLTGVRDPYVQGLRRTEVPMSVGQAVSQSGLLGAGIKRMEDLTTGIPGVGTVVNAGRTNSMQGFNRAAFNEGLAPIGERTGGVIQEQGIDLAQDATTRGYRSALDNVNVTPEPQFRTEYDTSVATGGAVPRVGPEFAAYEQANMAPLINQPSFDGNTIQDFIQQTRGADFGSDAMGNLVGKSVTGAENAMRGLVGRQAPDVLPKLSKADQAYRQVQILRDAVNRARGGTMSGETGIFTPSQLADATAANAKKYGGTQGTTRQPFFDLARAGQAVLPSKVGDSGSAGRLLMQGALGTAGVGAVGGGYAANGTEGASYGAGGALALGALLAAGGSKTAQKAAVKLLLDRPDAFIKAGNKIKGRAQIGGIFGAPILAGTVPLLSQ